jgi:hypothetical protein
MARPPGEAADDGNLGEVRQWRVLFWDMDLHGGDGDDHFGARRA